MILLVYNPHFQASGMHALLAGTALGITLIDHFLITNGASYIFIKWGKVIIILAICEGVRQLAARFEFGRN
jgi:hypothetical protein